MEADREREGGQVRLKVQFVNDLIETPNNRRRGTISANSVNKDFIKLHRS